MFTKRVIIGEYGVWVEFKEKIDLIVANVAQPNQKDEKLV